MENKPYYVASPRWVAMEKGFQLVAHQSEGGIGEFEYHHPTSEIGVLISVRAGKVAGEYEFDWSIHEPQTQRVMGAEWNQPNGVLFLKEMEQVQFELSSSPSSSEDSDFTNSDSDYNNDSEGTPKEKCISCGQLRELDSTLHCYLC